MPADPQLLTAIPWFQTMDDDERNAVAALMKEVRFRRGQVIFKELEPGGVLYTITSGRVELSVIQEDKEKLVVDVLEPGEFFGEMSLIDGGGRSATAIALEDVAAYSLERNDFLDVLRRQPHAAVDVMTALTRRLRKVDERLRQRVRNPNEVLEEQQTFGERVADQVARFGGSWSFIFAFGSFLGVWIVINTVVIVYRTTNGETFDPYPFILLNLFLSMLAAIQAPVIMMSQNRQDAKDRVRSELDYQVNVKAELEIMQLHEKVDALEEKLLERLADAAGPRPGGSTGA